MTSATSGDVSRSSAPNDGIFDGNFARHKTRFFLNFLGFHDQPPHSTPHPDYTGIVDVVEWYRSRM